MIRSAFLVTSLSLAAAAAQEPAAAQTALHNVRIGCTASDTYGSGYFASDMGFFAQDGLNVELQTLNNGAAIAAGVISGAIDIGIAPPNVLANGYLRGLPFVIVAGASLTTPASRSIHLCVSKASGIKTAKELEGKTIGVNGLGIQDYLLDAWFAQSGADVSKVKLVELPFSEMGVGLERRAIDAATMTEFSLTVARKQYSLQVLSELEAAIAPQFLNSCWFTTRDFAQKNPDVIRRFDRAIYTAQKWANSHQSESAVILSKYSKIDVELIRSMTRVQFADQLRAADIQPLLDAAAKYGALARPVSAATLIYQ
jgi:ABC-type nitrate/sulfonate/bicarbonate transport system substrate-binding protein